jgi:hypothetical protein
MAIFVDLGEEDDESHQEGQQPWSGPIDAVKPVPVAAASIHLPGDSGFGIPGHAADRRHEHAHEPAARQNLNQNSMTQALGCYP